ncbi:MAG TPA: hypothetical protein DCE33_13995, partial [Rhodospirillaceae bacterium]|nr:hypothetical protein [Rhodospirillaceae bacterium]
MDFDLTDEQRLIQESAKRMVETRIQPMLDAHSVDDPLPKPAMLEILQACAELGMLGGRVASAIGGSEMQMLDLGLIYEQMPAGALFGVLSQEVTAARIAANCSQSQQTKFLEPILDARKIACTANTEPGAGSDSRALGCQVTEEVDGYRLQGRKMWISNISIADVINVTGVMGADDKGEGDLVRLLVDAEETPFEAAEIPTLGLRQAHLGEAVFENALVPAENRLGETGDAAKSLTVTWLGNRCFIALCAVNMAETALQRALDYAKERTQFGKAIAGHQLVQQRLADISAAVTSSRLLCYYALSRIDAGERANGVTAMAKRKTLA